MLTLNAIRQKFEEKNIPFYDENNFIAIENVTLADEEVPAVVFVSCDDEFLEIQCFLPKLLKLDLNQKILSALSSLNDHFKFFQITLEEPEKDKDKLRLNMIHSIPTKYLSNDPEVAFEMTIRALRIMDVCYAEIMRARFSN